MPHNEHRGRYSTRYTTYPSRPTRSGHITESRSSSSDYISRPTYSHSDYISKQIDPAAFCAYDYDASEDYIARPYESRADYISPRSKSPAPRPQLRRKGTSGSGRKTKTKTKPGVERRDSGIAGSRTRPALSSSGSMSGSSFSSPIEREKEVRRKEHSNSPSSVGSCLNDERQKGRYGFVADRAWEERREVVRSQGFRNEEHDEVNESRDKHRITDAQRSYTPRKEGRRRTLPGAFVDEEPEEAPQHRSGWAQDDEKAGSDVSTFRSGTASGLASGLASPLLSPSFSAPYSPTSSKRRGSDYDDIYDSSCDRCDASDIVRDESSDSNDSASDKDDISNGSDYVFDGEGGSDAESIAAGSDVASASDAESEPEVREQKQERERGYMEAYVEDDYEGYSDDEA